VASMQERKPAQINGKFHSQASAAIVAPVRPCSQLAQRWGELCMLCCILQTQLECTDLRDGLLATGQGKHHM
jgi:hypothetical protein